MSKIILTDEKDLILPENLKKPNFVPIMAITTIPEALKIDILRHIVDGIINEDAKHADVGMIKLMAYVNNWLITDGKKKKNKRVLKKAKKKK